MTLTQIADIADLLAAFGIIVTLGFLAWEMRKNAEQTRLGNWHSTLSALREQKRRTDDPTVADIIDRGRANFDALTGAEKITFGYWMEEWAQAMEGLLVSSATSVHGREEMRHAALSNFAAMFAHPGCRQWWRWSGLEHRWPRALVKEIEGAIAKAESGSP